MHHVPGKGVGHIIGSHSKAFDPQAHATGRKCGVWRIDDARLVEIGFVDPERLHSSLPWWSRRPRVHAAQIGYETW